MNISKGSHMCSNNPFEFIDVRRWSAFGGEKLILQHLQFDKGVKEIGFMSREIFGAGIMPGLEISHCLEFGSEFNLRKVEAIKSWGPGPPIFVGVKMVQRKRNVDPFACDIR